MIKLKDILTELDAKSFSDRYGKNKWIDLDKQSIHDYADDIAELIASAYASKGGNFEIKNGDDLRKSDINFWVATDVDNDPDADAAIGGKTTPFGTKLTMIGQDGSSAGKRAAITKMIDAMKHKGFYAELDPDLAEKLRAVTIKDETIVRKILAGKEIKDFNTETGSYNRMVSGTHAHTKVLVGIPKV